MVNCGNCRWYEPSRVSLGHCRKNPPTIITWPDGESYSDFPEVAPEDWCGQWEANEATFRSRYSKSKPKTS